MSKGMNIIFMMFGLIMVSAIILGIAWYYGTSDWTWIAQENALLVLVLVTLGFALITLGSHIKRH